MKYEIGKYYIDEKYEDIVLIKGINYENNLISVDIIEDEKKIWGEDIDEWVKDSLMLEYNYRLHKGYNTPLWKALNETN